MWSLSGEKKWQLFLLMLFDQNIDFYCECYNWMKMMMIPLFVSSGWCGPSFSMHVSFNVFLFNQKTATKQEKNRHNDKRVQWKIHRNWLTSTSLHWAFNAGFNWTWIDISHRLNVWEQERGSGRGRASTIGARCLNVHFDTQQ